MIDKIVSFISYFPANLKFQMAEYEYYGLSFKPKRDFPWEGRKERKRFLNDLAGSEKDGEVDRFLYWSEEWEQELIHQRFTGRFIALVSAYTWLLFALLGVLGGADYLAMGAMICVLLSLLLKYGFHRSISKLYTGMKMTRMLLGFLKENRAEKSISDSENLEVCEDC